MLDCVNFNEGKWETPPSSNYQDVLSPYTGQKIGRVLMSKKQDVDRVIMGAQKAFKTWGETPIKERTQVLFKFREILHRDIKKISQQISQESGKLPVEAEAGLLKGIEVLEYALSLQNLDIGGKMQVSRGVTCEYRREPLGVVVGITPFNFPAMVPMWMIPIALAMGNSFVWKPSDKTPLTSLLLAEALKEAGLPAGAFSVVQGGREAVEALCDHPTVQAIGFVGSSPVAKAVYVRATSQGKRALCLGGAKNPIILVPDADEEMAAQGIAASFTGCAGQRCMAASVLLAVGGSDGKTNQIIDQIVQKVGQMLLGQDMGAIISKASLDKLNQGIARAQKEGAKILIDGRGKKPSSKEYSDGNWLGPTILDGVQPKAEAACDELFGPILSIVRCKNLSEALEFENKSPFGNASSVFTTNGAIAEEVAHRSHAGMIGINIGVPVPREPFSFGGFNDSRFGDGDITGRGGVEFWSRLKKVTYKWSTQTHGSHHAKNWMS